jgi:crossover junction endodeoxyribonuclease RuvC
MGSEPRRAIGIDPGTARLGYAVVESRSGNLSLLACGCIVTTPSMKMPDRLKLIYDEAMGIIAAHAPREMAIEELFFAKNVTTAVAVGQARGVALLVAAQHGIPVSEYKPMQVKQAVHGYGLATKAQVGEMVRVLLRLDTIPTPDDAADAAAIAICHLNMLTPERLLSR